MVQYALLGVACKAFGERWPSFVMAPCRSKSQGSSMIHVSHMERLS